MDMAKRKPLTKAERDEKARFRRAFNAHKRAWEEAAGVTLTQQRLAEIAGTEIQGEPYSQGMVWQYLSPDKDTRMPVKFVQFVASMLGFDPGSIGPKFEVPEYVVRASAPTIGMSAQPATIHATASESDVKALAMAMSPEDFTALVEQFAPKAGLTEKQRLRIVRAAVDASR